MPCTLLHVGYVKTGSTWLQWNVLDNRSLGFQMLIKGSRITREIIAPYPLWYDPKAMRSELERARARCEEEGVVGVLSHERFSGSPITGGYDNEIIAGRLAELLPDARVFLVFREQRDHLRSIYNEYVALGGPCALEIFLDPPLLARMPLFEPRFLEFHRLISLYRELFGPQRVLAVPFELLKRDPQQFVGLLFDFVELPRVEDVATIPVRPSLGAATISMLRRSNLFFDRNNSHPAAPFDWPVAGRIVRRLGRALPAAIHRKADQARRRVIQEFVGDRYASSNRLTAELTGFDLEALGYPVSDGDEGHATRE